MKISKKAAIKLSITLLVIILSFIAGRLSLTNKVQNTSVLTPTVESKLTPTPLQIQDDGSFRTASSIEQAVERFKTDNQYVDDIVKYNSVENQNLLIELKNSITEGNDKLYKTNKFNVYFAGGNGDDMHMSIAKCTIDRIKDNKTAQCLQLGGTIMNPFNYEDKGTWFINKYAIVAPDTKENPTFALYNVIKSESLTHVKTYDVGFTTVDVKYNNSGIVDGYRVVQDSYVYKFNKDGKILAATYPFVYDTMSVIFEY
jgi:hypothetical protein